MPENDDVKRRLPEAAVRAAGVKTKRETVDHAYRESERKRRAEELISLFGTIEYDVSYDKKRNEGAPDEYFEQKGAEGMLTYLEKEIRRYKKQGREEGQLEKGISVALAMLGNGEPEDKILLYTGFTPEQLAEIREGRLRRE